MWLHLPATKLRWTIHIKSHCISQRKHHNAIYLYNHCRPVHAGDEKIHFWPYLVIALLGSVRYLSRGALGSQGVLSCYRTIRINLFNAKHMYTCDFFLKKC